MSAEADKLRAEIKAAEEAIEKLSNQLAKVPAEHRDFVDHQIERVKDQVRDMKIKLASIEDRKNVCPVCQETTPPGWLWCVACHREVPTALWLTWKCASHHAHARRANKAEPASIAQHDENERRAAADINSHLRQHGSALKAA